MITSVPTFAFLLFSLNTNDVRLLFRSISCRIVALKIRYQEPVTKTPK